MQRYRSISTVLSLINLHSTHYYIVNRDVHQLDKESNETHQQKPQACSASNFSELCEDRLSWFIQWNIKQFLWCLKRAFSTFVVRLGTFLHQISGILHKFGQWLDDHAVNVRHYKLFFLFIWESSSTNLYETEDDRYWIQRMCSLPLFYMNQRNRAFMTSSRAALQQYDLGYRESPSVTLSANLIWSK